MSPASPSALGSSRGAARPFEEAPAPVPLTSVVSIVGSFGDVAFLPNPVQAAIGDMVVWMNEDVRIHHIVLDDGTEIGNVLPGEATAPLPVATADPIGFHCTLHPSMVGSINGVAVQPAPEPAPEPAPGPEPEPPPYYPPYEPDPYPYY
jgi:plastocyanin